MDVMGPYAQTSLRVTDTPNMVLSKIKVQPYASHKKRVKYQYSRRDAVPLKSAYLTKQIFIAVVKRIGSIVILGA